MHGNAQGEHRLSIRTVSTMGEELLQVFLDKHSKKYLQNR